MRVLFGPPRDFDPTVLDGMALVDEDPDVWIVDPCANYIIDGGRLDKYPSLQILATPSTGNNHIDLNAVRQRGIKFLSLLDDRKGLNEISASAEYTLMLLLAALRYAPPRELQGRTIGLVGYGRIGRRMARWCQTMGANVIAHDPPKRKNVSLEVLFDIADAVVVCCTLNDQTRGMITANVINLLPKFGRLVNTARGEIVELDGIRDDIIVASDFPHERANISSPHIAGATWDSRTKATRIIRKLVEREWNKQRGIVA